MPSKKLYFALTAAVALIGVAMLSRPVAHAAPAPIAQPQLGGMCYHVDFSDYVCPDSAAALRSPLPDAATEVQAVSVTVRYKDGRTVTSQLPATTDAVFLSKKSLRTFLLLHYLATDDKKFNEVLTYINRPPLAKTPPRKP